MMDDDNIGKEGPEHFTEHGDEEGEDSDSGGSNLEEDNWFGMRFLKTSFAVTKIQMVIM